MRRRLCCAAAPAAARRSPRPAAGAASPAPPGVKWPQTGLRPGPHPLQCNSLAIQRFVERRLSIEQRKLWVDALARQLARDSGAGTAAPAAAADKLFRVLDTNNDGLVSQREFRIWFLTYFLPSSARPTAANDEGGQPRAAVARATLASVALRSAVPYLAFGLVDNAVMLGCGEYIDRSIAVRLGFSTMVSAGLGNALSCASGVLTGKLIERLCLRSRLMQRYSPRLTPKQSMRAEVKNAHVAGAVGGILVGCLVGMSPLLFLRPRRPAAAGAGP